MADNISLTATVNVKITKYDSDGNVVGVDEHLTELTEEEAKKLWHSQQLV